MSTRPSIAAQRREITGKKVATLRRAGVLPAVVFGQGTTSQSIQIDAHAWEVLGRKQVMRNMLVDLEVDGGRALPALVSAIHENPVTRRPQHIDFFIVKMTEEISIDVPLQLVGDSEAVTKHGGTLLHLRDTIHLKALPNDLPSSIEVDVSVLHDFDATLHVSDLIVPKGVTVLTDAAEPIARVQSRRVDSAAAGEAAEAAAASAAAAATAAAASSEEA